MNILSHLLVLASQKFYELLLRKHQRVREKEVEREGAEG